MIVLIDLAVYQDDSQWRYLDIIVNKVADGWHVWRIEDPGSIEETGWMGGSGREWLKELFQKAAIASSYPAPAFPRMRVHVAVNSENHGSLDTQKAAKFLSTPLTVMMENRFTDGDIFLNEVLNVLGSNEMNEQRAIAPDSICYDSQGGIGELPKLIVDYIERADGEGIPTRFVVFTDEDGEFPGDIKRNTRLVQDVCRDNSIPFATLSKRTIENYIPDEILDAWNPLPDSDNGKCIAAIKRMTQEQRDHYPMKKGLKIENADPAVQTLYQGISSEDLNNLSKGLGKEVIKNLQQFRAALSADAFRRRDWQGDLERLVQMIEDAL